MLSKQEYQQITHLTFNTNMISNKYHYTVLYSTLTLQYQILNPLEIQKHFWIFPDTYSAFKGTFHPNSWTRLPVSILSTKNQNLRDKHLEV